MRKFIITAEMRDLEQQVHKGEISYSRMIEILCEKADEYYEMKRQIIFDALIEEIARRQELIISEPDGIVRETMIANLLINFK